MGNYEQLKEAVSDVIKTNGNQEITGAILQNTLLSIISTIGSNSTFAGIAKPDTNPGTPDQNVFYIASEPGIYVNFNNIELNNKVLIISNKTGNWIKSELDIYPSNKNSIFIKKTYNNTVKELYVLDSEYTKFVNFKNLDGLVDAILSSDNPQKGSARIGAIGNEQYEENKIYELRTDKDDLVALIIFSGESVNYSGSGISVEEESYNIYNSERIFSYITNEIDDVAAKKISNNKLFNFNIKELYINTEDKTSNYTVSLFRLNMTGQSYTDSVYLQKNGVAFARIRISGLVPGNIYEMEIQDGSKSSVYIIFSGYSTNNVNPNGVKYELNKDVVFSYSENPNVENYIINSLIPEQSSTPNWTVNLEWNKYIKELYIPNASVKYPSSGITSLTSKKDECKIISANKNGDTIFSLGKDITEEYYKAGSITPIYSYNEKEIIGWVIFNYLGSDFVVSGRVRLFNLEVVENIENSPNIANMLNSNKQIILTGDSLQGQPQENSLPDILRGLTGMQVWNISCGGCRMAWRTEDGSNYYDKFSFSDLMDSLSKNDFSEQLNAFSVEMPTDFRYQYANMININNDKETIIICNYMANDITGGSEIGNLWEYTNQIGDFVRTTFLGAMNYGLTKVLTQYPLHKFLFLGNFYRLLEAPGEKERTQPPYIWVNSIGKKADDYMNAEIENCNRIGLPFENMIYWGIRNYFSMNFVTTDGTHFNPYGFFKYAKFLQKKIY